MATRTIKVDYIARVEGESSLELHVRNGGVDAVRLSIFEPPRFFEALLRGRGFGEVLDIVARICGICPIDKRQLLELITALLAGRKPQIPAHSVCEECKRRGTACVMVAHGTPCLGPVTQAGCGAICPAYGRGCYGCFGPTEAPNTSAIAREFSALGMTERDIARVFRTFNAAAEPFRKESQAHGD